MWRAKTGIFGGCANIRWLEFDASEDAWETFVMEDYKAVDAIEVEWSSPMKQWLLCNKAPECRGVNQRIRAVGKRGWQPLHKLAAQKAFWRLGRPWLVSMAHILDCEVHNSDSLFGVLFKLVTHVLGAKEGEALEILKQRRFLDPTISNMSELAGVAAVKENLTRDEQELLKEVQRGQDNAKDETKTFSQEWKERNKEYELALASAKAGKLMGKKKVADDPLKLAKIMSLIPPDAITQSEASRMAPPGGSIWNDWKRGRWCGHFAPYARTSVPWLESGHYEACLEVLRRLWLAFCDFHDVGTEVCPVQGRCGAAGISA